MPRAELGASAQQIQRIEQLSGRGYWHSAHLAGLERRHVKRHGLTCEQAAKIIQALQRAEP